VADGYRFGVVPQFESRKLSQVWQPILRDLEQRTGLALEMVSLPTIPEFEKAFMRGAFDFAYMNPYHAMLAMRHQGYVPLVRDGRNQLFGILVVRRDSPVQEVRELAGREIAFPAPNAIGASLLMRADLESVHRIEVKPVYVQDHSSVYMNVALGLMPAGSGVMSTLTQQRPEIRDQLRVIYRTRGLASHPVTAHPRVPEKDRERLRAAFLEMAGSSAGQAQLAEVPMQDLVGASEADYSDLAKWGLEKYYVDQR
jgi:phosphonate transport system substrate-binding protein